jgi:hypothetical protein
MAKSKKRESCQCAENVNKQLEPRGLHLKRRIQFNFETKKASMSPPSIEVERCGDGKRVPTTLLCSYCPFCGRKF